ncbi:Crp/Fnr family transcriptional regulator [Bartonella tamiae]|uniref:Cyclic nucleotide-binding domain-containing protein n=1 Tax=Bartonella tamiae Th239 TaxID=1094558 RepID=J1K1R7_9HYPH|nr:Crp/Fnr family transcriptional regulator [Bartonella tamiae]EJF91005.1 hypothetical protein ME5_00337 [Bartonella tamiae Th239]EJF93330.1 hypothetical protein MEG_01544 [Bartonella tamiae Th307]
MLTNDDIALLKRLDFFKAMTQEHLRMLLFDAQSFSVDRHKILFHEGDITECAYVILSGSFQIYKTQNDKNHLIETALIGSLLCELGMVSPIHCPVSAVADEDCVVLQITRESFLRLMQEYPEIAHHIHDYVSTKMQQLIDNLSQLPSFTKP